MKEEKYRTILRVLGRIVDITLEGDFMDSIHLCRLSEGWMHSHFRVQFVLAMPVPLGVEELSGRVFD